MNTEANRKTEWVVGIGEALWDILPEGRKIGGAPANFAYHMSQFGLRSCAVSAVGDDEAGRELRNQLREKGWDICWKRCRSRPGRSKSRSTGRASPATRSGRA